jgi:hypothetical protein
MLRRMFTVLSALSLLLCVAVVALWVRSHGHPARAEGRIGTHGYGITSASGGVEVWRGLDPWDLMDSADPYRPADSLPGWLGVGRAGSWENAGGAMESRGLRFPYALPALVASALPLVWVVRRLAGRARQRAAMQRPGLCSRCSYDLRATPGRCPECGTAAAGNDA